MTARPDYYRALGLDERASADEIKKAYRELARQYHPDTNGGAGAEARFKEISEAYEVLSDPERRRIYDRGGSAFKERDPGRREQEAVHRVATYSNVSAPPSRRRGMFLLWAAVAVLAVVLAGPRLVDVLTPAPSAALYDEDDDSGTSAKPLVQNLRSRWVSPTTLEIRGRSNVDGFRFRLRGSVSGRRYVLGEVSPRAGRFRTTMAAPAEVQGRKVRVSARLILE